MSIPSIPAPETDEAEALQQRLRRILEGTDFPLLSRQIVDTITTLDDDAASVQRLANRVLNEYSLTIGVVRTANSVHFRRGHRPIQSATHAMMMLGARTVRQIASSLMFFDSYAKKSPALKELMLLSLLTANHASAIAAELGLAPPEEAHLCGMFRNLGEVLIAANFPEDYATIRALIVNQGLSELVATKQVLGFAYTDLAVEVSRRWGLPEAVIEGIVATANTSASVMAAVTSFSHDITQALYREEQSESSTATAVAAVREQHGAKVKMSREQASSVVSSALQATRELFVNPQIATDRLRFGRLTRAAQAAFGDIPVALEAGEPPPTTPASLRVELRRELEEDVKPESGVSLNDVILTGIETVLRAGPFDRVIVCFLTPDKARLVARIGLGPEVETLIPRFDFPMSVRGGPIVQLTQQRTGAYLPTDRSLTAAEAKWAQDVGVRQFGVFPIIALGKLVGCLYFDRTGDGESPDRATVRYVKGIVDLLVEAMVKRRH